MGSIENLLHDEIDALEQSESDVNELVTRGFSDSIDALEGYAPAMDPLDVIDALESIGERIVASVTSDRTYYDMGIEAAAKREALLYADDPE